jgi:hypothetical protein
MNQLFRRTRQVIRQPLLRLYGLQSRPWYWHLARLGKLWSFYIRKVHFIGRSSIRESWEAGAIFSQVLKGILFQLMLALLVFTALSVIESVLISWNMPLMKRPLSDGAQLGLLTTLGQISATFLGLYFTAITVVASTAYAKVPGEIRSLVVQEQVGSVYFRILAQFAGTVTVMLTALAFKIPVGVLNTSVAAFLCLFSIFSFVILGIRAFQFFDPATLISYLNRNLSMSIHAVTSQGANWLDESFQAHHQRRAEGLLSVYSNLVLVASQPENLQGKGLAELGQGILRVLSYYSSHKAKIPSSSYWFKRTHEHKDWLLAPYHELEMALATATSVRPESVPDLTWLETQLCRLFGDILRSLGERSDLTSMLRLAATLDDTIKRLGRRLMISEALQVLKTALAEFRRCWSFEAVVAPETDLTSQNTNRLAIVEYCSCALIDLLLGMTLASNNMKPLAIEKRIATVDWGRAKTLYRWNDLPRRVIEELEFLKERLDSELRLDGKIMSPLWLHQEMLARGVVRFLDEAIKAICGEFETAFAIEAEAQVKATRPILVAQIVQRGLEACNKFSTNLDAFRTLHQESVALNRSKEYEWPEIDWAIVQSRVNAIKERLVVALASSSPFLAQLPIQTGWPDFFGHAYSTLADECFAAMTLAKEQLFRRLFPAFFLMALMASDKLREKLLAQAPRNLSISGEPLVDLLELSGYAAVLSKVHNVQFFEVVEKCWKKYFDELPDDAKRTQIIELLCLVTEPTGHLRNRDILRMRWKRASENLLHERGVLPDQFSPYDWHERREPLHPDPLVRAFASGVGLFTDAHSVFLSVHVFRRPEAASVEKPRRVEDFDELMRREVERDSGPSPDA